MEETFTCSNCGAVCSGSELMEFDGQELCEGCLDETTLLCEHCGERIWREENAGSEDCPLCQDCYDHHYDRCSDCGRLIRNTDAYYANDDEDTPYCCDCIDHHRGGIQSYYYKPDPIFHGDGSRYLGVELEIDDGGELDSVAEKLLAIGNHDAENIYIKHDGSLNEGINAYHGDPMWDSDCVLSDEGSADDLFNSYYCRTSGGKVFVLDLSSDGNLGDIMILNPDNQFVYGVMIASGDSSNEKYEKLFKEYYEYCQSYSADTTDIPENGDLTAPSDPTGDSSGVSDEVLLNNAYQAIIDYCANYEGSLNPDCYPKNGKVNRTGSVAYVTVDQWDMQIWWNGYVPKDATVLLDESTGTVMQCTVNY